VNLQSRPPESHIFFLDRSLGKHVVAVALRSAGATVEVHDDHFSPDATDEEWLADVGQRKWIVFTKDNRLRYHPREKAALLKYGVRTFILTARDLRGEEMGRAFTIALPKIEKFLRGHTKACIVALSRDGQLRPIVV
jgi:predicted nuclease of predicted toxin-antitoxin system